jgi:hypothetical protein
MGLASRGRPASILGRSGATIASSLAVAACASIQNMAPDPASFRLPDRSTILPSNISSYSLPASPAGSVPASELVDSQGLCAGAAPAYAEPGAQRAVALEMSECEVMRRLGPPQATESQPGGVRSITMTYTAGERAGIYRFVGGRLVSVERGAEPPPPPATKKPARRAGA